MTHISARRLSRRCKSVPNASIGNKGQASSGHNSGSGKVAVRAAMAKARAEPKVALRAGEARGVGVAKEAAERVAEVTAAAAWAAKRVVAAMEVAGWEVAERVVASGAVVRVAARVVKVRGAVATVKEAAKAEAVLVDVEARMVQEAITALTTALTSCIEEEKTDDYRDFKPRFPRFLYPQKRSEGG